MHIAEYHRQEIIKKYLSKELSELEIPIFPSEPFNITETFSGILADAVSSTYIRSSKRRKLALHLFRKLLSATESYIAGEEDLLKFIQSRDDIFVYLKAVSAFENCITESWRFLDCLRSFPLQDDKKPLNIFEYDSDNIYSRINLIYNNSIKHVAAKDRLFGDTDAILPLWLNDDSIKTEEAHISYLELFDAINRQFRILSDLIAFEERDWLDW